MKDVPMVLAADFRTVSAEAAQIAQVAAVVVGGFFTYWKFIRGRTFRHRAELGLTAELWESGDATALLVRISMHNTGLSKIPLLPKEKSVMVNSLPLERWLVNNKEIYWGPNSGDLSSDVFEGHAWLEPGEVITDECLIPVPSSTETPLAFRVRAVITTTGSEIRRARSTRRIVWSATTLVPDSFSATSPQLPSDG